MIPFLVFSRLSVTIISILNYRLFKLVDEIYFPAVCNNNYLLTGNKVALFFTETNSRYFITRAIARVIIVREFVEVKKGTLLPVNT